MLIVTASRVWLLPTPTPHQNKSAIGSLFFAFFEYCPRPSPACEMLRTVPERERTVLKGMVGRY